MLFYLANMPGFLWPEMTNELLFSFKYDKHGNLQASTQRQARCYKLPDMMTPLPDDLQAFWM
jgi:hypothetical protein